ncbi:UNVERIFIED_CONTAM: hypothetical protein GTU68_030029 [Idotea baltica]|nr:hypothetical protein [Idotea baltica]
MSVTSMSLKPGISCKIQLRPSIGRPLVTNTQLLIICLILPYLNILTSKSAYFRIAWQPHKYFLVSITNSICYTPREHLYIGMSEQWNRDNSMKLEKTWLHWRKTLIMAQSNAGRENRSNNDHSFIYILLGIKYGYKFRIYLYLPIIIDYTSPPSYHC